MALNDLYKAVVHSTVFTEDCYNVFWYRQMTADTGTLNMAQELADEVRGAFSDQLNNLLSEDAEFQSVSVYNYTDPDEFGLNNDIITGTVVQESAPSQWCIGFKFQRGGVGWNYPRKRVSGFPLSAYVGNGVEPGLATVLEGIANLWQTYTLDGATFQWKVIRPGVGFALGNPVIVAEKNVGLAIAIYDASQASRKN